MTRHFINSPIVVVTITITLFIGLCIGQIFTDSVAFDSSITWKVDGIYGSVGGLTTQEASRLSPSDDLYIACTSGLMKLNKSSTLSTNTSLVYPVVTSTITDLVAPHLVNRSGRIEFWVPTRQSPARFGRFNTTTLAILVDGFPNPVDIDVVENIFASFPYNGYSYFIAETGLVQVYQQNPSIFTPFTPSSVSPFFSSSSVTADQWLEGTVVFIGSQNGTVYKIVVDEDTFQSSTIQRYNLPTTQQFTASAADPIRGYVYFSTPGSSNTLARVFKVPMTSFNTILGVIDLPAIDFDVASAIIDPYGLLYLGLTVFPPKVAQISLPDFVYETTLVLPSTVGAALSPLLDPSSGRLFWSSYDITSFDPQLVATDPASGCPSMCSGNGDCIYRYCYCDSFVSPNNFTFNYTQPACFGKPCDYDCHGNGTCDLALGICVCNENFTGSYCDIPQCPNNCTATSGQGSCVYSTDGTPLICSCSEGWTGHDCSESTYLPCYRYDTCDECGDKNPNCGWCSDSATCVDGNELGPFFETGCHNWHYRECPKGLDIINWIILIIIIILFVINMISFTVDDTSGVEIPPRLDWYRFQRSCKAWTLLFQFQFIAACGLFDINFPTIFTSFTNFWYPLAFGYGLPTDNDSLESTSRRPLNVIQYVTYIEQTENQILSGVLLWSIIVFVAALILYFLSIVFALIRGKTGLGDNVKDRVFYVSCRIIEAFYFGIVVFSATQLSQYKYVSNGMLGLAAVIFIVIGLGWPIAHLALVAKYQKNLFKKAQRVRFFPMYGTLQVLKLKFAVIPILKKLLLGVFIGFLAENRVPQLLLVWLVHILYFIFVLAGDPFIDILQKYLELFISGINILSMPVLMGFLKDEISFDAQVGVTVLFTVLQILCVVGSMAFYFISWSQMHEVFTFNQLKALLCCRKVDPSVTELQRLR